MTPDPRLRETTTAPGPKDTTLAVRREESAPKVVPNFRGLVERGGTLESENTSVYFHWSQTTELSCLNTP